MTNSPFGGFSFEEPAENPSPAAEPARPAAPASEPRQKREKAPKAPKEPRQKREKAPKAPKEPRQKREKAPKLGKEVRQDRLSERGRKFLILSVIFILTASAAVYYALSAANSEPQGAWVVRATSSIDAGDVITSSDLLVSEITLGNEDAGVLGGILQEDAVAASESLIGLTAISPIFEGQQLRKEMFSEIELSVGRTIAADERLVSVSANVSVSLAGIISAGDTVDIVSVDSRGVAILIADAAEVMAVDVSESAFRTAQQAQSANTGLSADDILPTDPIPGIYTMRVDASEAMPLAAADAAGTLYLMGRTASADSLSPVVDFRAYGCSKIPADEVLPLACEDYLLDVRPASGTVGN